MTAPLPSSHERGSFPAARLLVFPLTKRRRWIERQAELAARMHANACERHIQRVCRTQADFLGRKGADAAEIAQQVKSLEAALRSALWKIIILGDRQA